MQVYVKGRLWHTTSVTMDAPLVLTYKLNLSRIWVTGRALWHETCGPAAGLSVQVGQPAARSVRALQVLAALLPRRRQPHGHT